MSDSLKPEPQTTADRLRTFSKLGTEQALFDLGDPDTGPSRSASASLDMDSVTQDGSHSPKRRQLKVDVTMTVTNDLNSPPNPRPNPPHKRRKYHKHHVIASLVALLVIVIIAALFLNEMGRTDFDSSTTITSSQGTVTANTGSPRSYDATLPAIPASPTLQRLDDAVMPSNTVTLGQNGDLVCDGEYHTLNQVPDFAMEHTHMWVHDAATQWRIRCLPNLSGATVVALDASRNVINRQTYGANFRFDQQLTFVQGIDASGYRTVQVDFFAPFNTFIGRTIYRFDSSNRVSEAYLQDNFQRPLQSSHLERDKNGAIVGVITDNTPRNGGGRFESTTQSEIQSALRSYYTFDSFD